MKQVKYLCAVLVLLISLIACNTETVEDPVVEVEPTIDPSTYTNVETLANDVQLTYITFDDMVPDGYTLSECWNGIGMDDDGVIYIGWTSKHADDFEDFLLYSYDPVTEVRNFIGTMMEASRQADNLLEGEQIPKGHTKIICVDNKMYLASQGFHDFKEEIDDLPNFRGSHLYEYDIETGVFRDLSADLPGGVVTEHEGIVALTYKEDTNELIGLTHPHSNMVFYDLDDYQVNKVVDGIPWVLNNPLSREVIADKYGKVYTYRGTEYPNVQDQVFNMWVYDTETDEMSQTDQLFNGGFWSGQVTTKDGETTYISTVNGHLFSLDTSEGTVEDLGLMVPVNMQIAKIQPMYLYDITLSADEKSIYGLPAGDYGDLFKYDIDRGMTSSIAKLDDEVYSSNNLMGKNGEMYFAKFDAWDFGDVALLIVELPE